MLRARFSTFFCGLLMLALSAGLLAHHAIEVHYDTSDAAIVTYTGVVKNFSLLNPHSFLVVTVVEEGVARDWVLEGQSGTLLARAGWRFDMLTSGVAVEFSAFPARSGEPAGRILVVRVGDAAYCSDRCELFGLESPWISRLPAGVTAEPPSS